MEDLSWLTSGPNKLILKTVASKNIIEPLQAGYFDKQAACYTTPLPQQPKN